MLMEWNQTFNFKLTLGTEKVHISLRFCSLLIGEKELDAVTINLEDLLQGLVDQKYSKQMTLSEKDTAFHYVIRFRHDESVEKLQDVISKLSRIKTMSDKIQNDIILE
mmetsp:Transcript_35497/g.26405  ORF Transcript_35497/g.26405 Transcript_35497/m.26405 type:complete len:108 (-) Transcript_35497:1327-1650(-)